MTLLAAVHSATGTFHSFAAACTSIMRAVAPPLRTYSCEVRMPRLPPVEKSPHARLRATLWPGVGNSVVTFDQSHSSSSATSCASPVIVPWPISERAMRITTVSSGRTTTQAFISGPLNTGSAAAAGPTPNGTRNPSDSPPPTATAPARNERRLTCGAKVMACPRLGFGGRVNRLAYLLIGAAAANIGDGAVDIGVGRV